VRQELLKENEDLLKDVKVYSSSEGRVISTALTFSCVFLDKKELPEGFVAISKEMLDDSQTAKEQLDGVKKKLQMILSGSNSSVEAHLHPRSIWNEMISEKTDSSPLSTPQWQTLALSVSTSLKEIIEVLSQMRSVLSEPVVSVSADWSSLFLERFIPSSNSLDGTSCSKTLSTLSARSLNRLRYRRRFLL
jgi:hypothetical protein